MKREREVFPIKVGEQTVLAVVQVGEGEEEVALRALSFDDFTQGLEALATELTKAIAKVKPDKATVEFNVTLALSSSKLAALFLDSSASGSVKVTLTWGKG